ncbi:hypothetical protein PHET_06540 [Paragonimus heterotremus]|uniref:Protein SZT2 n=1 Tax=Paragonimus heterotremus TaxID=100268 RepID=A0A8J4SYS5_9TREM|nr:hypothetical protein PHET_06540 [Paragonimus heterotremus]
MDSTRHRIDKLYVLPRQKIIPCELLSEWFVSHFGCPFVYDPEKRIFFPKCREFTEHTDYSGLCRHSLFQLVSVSPFIPHSMGLYVYDMNTESRCLQTSHKFTLVIDWSFSLLSPNSTGRCGFSDVIDALRILLEQMTADQPLLLPGSKFRLPEIMPIVTVIVVVPGLQCYTLLAGWPVRHDEITAKISILKKLLSKIGRKLVERSQQSSLSRAWNRCNFLVDLLKHGILSASFVVSDMETSSIIILTDAAFSVNNLEVLDRSLTHLKAERIRCSFVLLNSELPPSNRCAIEGSALNYVVQSNSCVSQVELCSFLVKSTGGFLLNARTDLIHFHDASRRNLWNALKETLFTVPVTSTMHADNLPGDLNWVPLGTLQTQSKLIRAPIFSVLTGRLRDGYKLRHVELLSGISKMFEPTGNSLPSTDFLEPFEEPNLRASDCAVNVIQLELELPWKVGIVFHVGIRGVWHEFHEKNHECNQSSPPEVEPERMQYPSDNFRTQHSNLRPVNSCRPEVPQWAWNRQTSETYFKVSASYSLVNEIVRRPQHVRRTDVSLYNRFVAYHRHLSMTDQQLEHLAKFSNAKHVLNVPEALSSRLVAAFSLFIDSSGRQIGMPNQSHNTTLHYALNSEFSHYWRFFLELNPLECYRWMSVHNLYGILEHDSQLPFNLHLPTEGTSYTVSLTCRQSLDRLHALLANWCSFVLLENSTYVRFLCTANCEHVGTLTEAHSDSRVHNQLSSNSDQHQANTESLDSEHSFCIVRLETILPEFRLRIGFISGTAMRVQHELVQQLRTQLSALRFPPRGRQAIPKSRHKSGAPPAITEATHVPPLQRSWEDTPCCHVFYSRLDRLILNAGFWSADSKLSKPTHSHQGGMLSAKIKGTATFQQRNFVTYPVIASPRPSLGPALVKQHLYHRSRMWVVQPIPLATDGLRTLFSSLVNLRLQEGFHLVRVGPQPGFISLAAELFLAVDRSSIPQPCLIQYLLYPVDEWNVSDVNTSVAMDSLAPLNGSLRNAVSRVRYEHKMKCKHVSRKDGDKCIPVCNMTLDEATCISSYPFRLVQVLTEVWTQPIEGRIVNPPQEISHWTGLRFEEIAKRIFTVDERCVVSYVTFERLCTILRTIPLVSPVYMSRLVSTSTCVPCTVGCVEPELDVYWAPSDIITLLTLAPQNTILCPLLSSTATQKNSQQLSDSVYASDQCNDRLLSELCSGILNKRSVVEIHLATEDFKYYILHLCQRVGLNKTDTELSSYPNWRCFVGSGGLTSENIPRSVAPDAGNSNAVITVLFLPATTRDAAHPVLQAILSKQLNGARWNFPKVPMFFYTCSRSYLSYLIVDSWTYKVPPDYIFNLSHPSANDGDLIDTLEHNISASSPFPTVPPNDFLNVGCQNTRLTPELNIIWSASRSAVDFVSRAHLNAYALTVYYCLSMEHSLEERDFRYILNASQRGPPDHPFSMDLTPFVLCTCEHLLSSIRRKHAEIGTEFPKYKNDYTVLLNQEQWNLSSQGERPLQVQLETVQSESTCTDGRSNLFSQLFDCYTYPVPGYSGIFAIKSRQINPRGSLKVPCHARTNASMFHSVDIESVARVTEDPSVSAVHPNASESDEGDTSETSVLPNQVLSFATKRSASQLSSDPLILNVGKWFGESSNGAQLPLFVQIRALLTYCTESVNLPLWNGLPLFCIAHFLSSLLSVVKKVHNEPLSASSVVMLELDLSLLHCRLEIMPLVWCSGSSALLEWDTVCTHPPFQPPSQFHCHTLAADEVSRTIDKWFNHNEGSLFNCFQRTVLCSFIFRLAWEMEKEIVVSLRTITPVTESIAQLVLRHIEDTQKLLRTPLFDELKLNRTDSHPLIKDMVLSSSDDNQVCSNESRGSTKRSLKDRSHSSAVFDLKDPKESILISRVRLDFVSYSSAVFGHFLSRFEHLSFSSVGACLHRLNDYYFLKSTASTLDCEHPEKPGEQIGVVNLSSRSRFVRYPSDKQSLSLSLTDPEVSGVLTDARSKTEFSRKTNTSKSSTVPARSRPQNRFNSFDKLLESQQQENSFALAKNSNFGLQFTPPSQVTSSQGYEGDSSEASEESVLRASALRSRLTEQHSTLETDTLMPSCMAHGTVNQVPYTLPPYWLFFRLCSNSVTLFFHHPDTHCRRDRCGVNSRQIYQQLVFSSFGHTRYNSAKSSRSLQHCPFCMVFQTVVKQINSVIRVVNQRLLLDKLRNERICDVLLLAPPKDPESSDTNAKDARNHIPIPNRTSRKSDGHKVTRPKQWEPNRATFRRTSESYRSSEQAGTEGEKLSDNLKKNDQLTYSTAAEKDHILVSEALYSAQQTNTLSKRASLSSIGWAQPPTWCPGCFACPVQLSDRIRLHPRVFLAASAAQGIVGPPLDRGQRVVAALRKLLDKPSIYNQPNMFFVIDFAPLSVTSLSPESKKESTTKPASLALGSRVCFDADAVFYMLLEVTTEKPKTSSAGSPVHSFFNETDSLQSNDRPSAEPKLAELSGDTHHPLHLAHVRRLTSIAGDKVDVEHFLQITLHGIEKPSRQLCNSVREMLQVRLDSLVLEHFSDSLSRNAISRLSAADINFLINRRWHCPKSHCLISLPRIFCTTTDWQPALPYMPGRLILALCHYLKQNLSLFLHAVKLDREAALCNKSELIELFLYNRPRAHGVAKPGVATLLFQLLTKCTSGDGSAEKQYYSPYTIADWSLPQEFLPQATKNNFTIPSFDDLYAAVTDFTEFSQDKMLSTGPSSQLVLSIQIWERGDADIENLKCRLKTTVLHSLYDLITEFFVLTAPIKLPRTTITSGTSATTAIDQSKPTTNEFTANVSHVITTDTIYRLNPYIPSVVLPWFKKGFDFESSLVLKVTLQLTSISCLAQLIGDLLRPFNNSLYNTEDFFPPIRSPMISSSFGLNPNASVTAVPIASSSPNVKFGSSSLSGVTFHLFAQSNADGMVYYPIGMDKLQLAGRLSRPGEMRNYLIIGRNFSAWRQLIRGQRRTFSGVVSRDGVETTTVCSPVELRSQFTKCLPNQSVDRLKPEVNLPSPMERDELLRMQSLYMTVSLPTPSSTVHTSKTESEDKPGRSGDCFNEFPSDSVRVSSKPTSSTITNEPSSSGTPVCKFPEFCPITFGLSPSVAPISPSSKPNWGSGPSVDRSTSTTLRHEVTSGAAGRPSEKPLTVLVPRQTFCLFVIEGRQITLYTYNWSKEEAERLAGRLTTLVEWHNSRFKLLSILSMQKLGLFHNLDESVSRRYASRAVSLVYNACPPELTPAMESGSIGSVGNLLDRQTIPANFSISAVPSGSNTGASVSVPSKLFPATRRRYPTSGGIDNGTTVVSTASTTFHPFSPLPSVSHLGIKLPELDTASVNHFSHLFQDCGRIPPLEETGSMDLVYRHGRQALVAIEADRLRAQQLELLSLPFRAWQEGRKRKQAGEYGTDTATSKLIETPSRSSNGASRCGALNAEAALSSDPLSKRLKRFSSIRLACRHLHTICTPILFCPSIRAQVVRSVQTENRTLRRVAEFCYQAQQEADRSSKGPLGSQTTTVCSQALFQWNSLGNDLRNLVSPQNVSRVHSCTLGSVSDSVHPLTSPLFGATVQPHPNNAQPAMQSPWLSWSRSELVDTLNELTNPHPINHNNNVTHQVATGSNALADTSFIAAEAMGQTTDWVRRIALSFLASYTQYIQHGVGFRVIPITEPNAVGSTAVESKTTVKPTGSYVLLHRAIHLAGVHIMEIFIRHSHLCVRLGTIELSRFSRHASRGLITGPLSAEVITQAAASAAVTAASVRRDAATSIRRDAANVVPGSETRSRAMMDVFESKTRRFEHQQHSSGFSWDESSRLCDYTHVHSFSYDYYIRAVHDYLSIVLMFVSGSDQRFQRRPSFGVPTRKSSHSKHTPHTTTDVFGVTDFPVAEFLSDIHILARQPPVFARNCLRAVQLACPVSAYLRPAQVFHHLIEEHQNYHIQIVRMARTVCDHPQLISTQPRHTSNSYTFGILELHPADVSTRLPVVHHHLSRQSSHTEFDTQPKAQSDFIHIAGSGVGGPSAIAMPSLTNDQPTSNSSRYSIAALVMADDHRNGDSLSTPLEATGRLLHLTIHLLAVDPHSRFPKSRLACAQDLSYSTTKHPVEWPACAPFHDPEAELPSTYQAIASTLHGLPRALSIENGDVMCALNLSAVSRNRHTSITETGQTESRPTPIAVVSAVESTTNVPQDYRWHVSYLGMWPSHHVPIYRIIEAAQSDLQARVTHLVKQSGLDCHKNLLWYRLFDSQHLLRKCATPKPLSPADLSKPSGMLASQSTFGSVSMSCGGIDVLEHEQLTFSEIEELVQSAPFELDVLRLDDRLLRTLQVGASHLNHVAHMINSQFAISGLGTGDRTHRASATALDGHLKQEPNLFVCCFRQNSENTDEDHDDNASGWIKHHMALLSPNFTDGFVLLSWSECMSELTRSAHTLLNGDPVHTFKNFQLRALFRTLGDPMNPGSMRRLIDSGQQIQALFFERSPLAALVTNFTEKLCFSIWQGLHLRQK